MFLAPAPAGPTGPVADLCAADVNRLGYLSNHTRLLAHRPEVFRARLRLRDAIAAGLQPRRYLLVSLAAAVALRSTYCALATGRALRDSVFDPETVRRIAPDRTNAGLAGVDVAVMDFAEQVVRDAVSIQQGDIARLRDLGLSDAEVLDIALAAAASCFLATVLDATGTRADAALGADLPAALRAALAVGRPPEASTRPADHARTEVSR